MQKQILNDQYWTRTRQKKNMASRSRPSKPEQHQLAPNPQTLFSQPLQLSTQPLQLLSSNIEVEYYANKIEVFEESVIGAISKQVLRNAKALRRP